MRPVYRSLEWLYTQHLDQSCLTRNFMFKVEKEFARYVDPITLAYEFYGYVEKIIAL